MPEYLTAQQTADLLQCGLSTVYEMAGERDCPVIRIGKRGVRFHRADLVDWLRNRAESSKALVPSVAESIVDLSRRKQRAHRLIELPFPVAQEGR